VVVLVVGEVGLRVLLGDVVVGVVPVVVGRVLED
jgi:hypothetical protein